MGPVHHPGHLRNSFGAMGRRALIAALLATTAAGTVLMAGRAFAQAQTTFDVPAGPLSRALATFGRQSGTQVSYEASIVGGKTSPGLRGPATRDRAIAQILQGSGLSYAFTDPTNVLITRPGSAASEGGPVEAVAIDGATTLGTIDVAGGGGGVPGAVAPFQTPAPVNYISQENIERFRGASPADIFRGTPGVMSGEARNGAGGIDVNIRGMQGMGRVTVTVDGAENGVTIYQGYQGASNRTFVDPDLLAGIDIKKGADAASRGIAGTVAMRTVGADDIVEPGNTWGMRVKGGFGTNTASPEPGAVGGYRWPSTPAQAPVATPSSEGMDRPGFLTPTSGSGSAVLAVREESYDLLWGYAYRNQGNYFAGANGPAANPVNLGPRRVCNTNNWCQNWPAYLENTGLTNYRAGEEVLNTQLETQSWLAKATLRLQNDQTVQLGYTGYRGEGGDLLASRFTDERTQPTQQRQTAGTKLDTGTLRYRWDPADNDLVNVTGNLWLTNLELRNPRRGGGILTPEGLGLGRDFRTGSDSRMWGGDLANTSALSTDYGSLEATLGMSYLNEDTRPSPYTNILEGWLNLRDGERQEASTFGKLSYKPLNWLTLNGGLRYSHFWSDDRRTVANSPEQLSQNPQRDEGGFSPSAGITVEPFEGTQIYATYASALRFPSLIESVSAFTLIVNDDLKPERANELELGVNVLKSGVFTAGDKAMFKFGYFNWDIDDYIAREYRTFQTANGGFFTGMQIHNIDRARFSGLEFSSRYEVGGFSAELAANYYLDVEFCRTANTCENKSLYADYATNQVPPEYMASLTVSQKVLDDALTLGGRVSYTGPRAIGHGDVTAQGLGQFIALINWDPYWMVDVFAEYKIDKSWTASARIENLTDQYYVDPLGLVNQPGPGRTFYASLTGKFGGAEELRAPKLPQFTKAPTSATDWTGVYAGVHGGAGFASLTGTTTALNGTPGGIPATESVDKTVKDLLFGGQAGFNYQFDNRFVLGLEADYSRTYLSGSQDALATEGSLAAGKNLQASTHYEFDWTGTVRARAGYAFDRLFVYASGGLAFLHEKQMRDQYRSDSADSFAPYGTRTDPFLVETAKATRAGWTLGAGAEYALNAGWSVKADYSYSRFDARDFNFPNARAGVTRDYTQTIATIVGYEEYPWFPGFPFPIYEYTYVKHAGSSGVVNGRKASNAIDLSTIKVGLNYRF